MIPKIDPKWRTSTVVGLCMQMRETDDYSATPILADALQDADCDDEVLLEFLRAIPPRAAKLEAERMVAIVMSWETREAVEWMEDLATELGDYDGYSGVQQMNYAVLIDTATDRAFGGGHCLTQHGSSSWQDDMWTRMEVFWEKYRLITGKTPPDMGENIFSCSC